MGAKNIFIIPSFHITRPYIYAKGLSNKQPVQNN